MCLLPKFPLAVSGLDRGPGGPSCVPPCQQYGCAGARSTCQVPQHFQLAGVTFPRCHAHPTHTAALLRCGSCPAALYSGPSPVLPALPDVPLPAACPLLLQSLPCGSSGCPGLALPQAQGPRGLTKVSLWDHISSCASLFLLLSQPWSHRDCLSALPCRSLWHLDCRTERASTSERTTGQHPSSPPGKEFLLVYNNNLSQHLKVLFMYICICCC